MAVQATVGIGESERGCNLKSNQTMSLFLLHNPQILQTKPLTPRLIDTLLRWCCWKTLPLTSTFGSNYVTNSSTPLPPLFALVTIRSTEPLSISAREFHQNKTMSHAPTKHLQGIKCGTHTSSALHRLIQHESTRGGRGGGVLYDAAPRGG